MEHFFGKSIEKCSEWCYHKQKEFRTEHIGGEQMKLDRQKFSLARARACMGQKDFEKAGIPKGTLYRAMSGRSLKPETLGKIAKALGVDVTEIIEQ